VCEVITEPSFEALQPTVILVHSIPALSSSGVIWAKAADDIARANIKANFFIVVCVFESAKIRFFPQKSAVALIFSFLSFFGRAQKKPPSRD
jgi:hypothetical protein